MLDFTKIKTIPITQRQNKFNIKDIVQLSESSIKSKDQTLQQLQELTKDIKQAKKQNKKIILMAGAHLIKLGLSEFIIDLIKKGFISHLAVNGAFAIHDFEVALIGQTSEDVKQNIKDGSFGMSQETGHYLNLAAEKAQQQNIGLGQGIANIIQDPNTNCQYKQQSIIHVCNQLNIPLTVHTAIGTEIIYQHPECNASALGQSSYTDFKTLTNTVSQLNQGVIINLGSAVILPEVFLKTLAISRNLTKQPQEFIAANIDMIDHYRSRVNVVQRHTSENPNNKGYIIIEKHENSIPTIHYLLTKQ